MKNQQPWRPSPLLAASAALHLVLALLIAWQWRWWPGLLALLVLNHLVLMAASLWPRSRLL
ncbi:MAG TPA: polysaccharide deacetylase family protein, partial [Methylibium sp.]